MASLSISKQIKNVTKELENFKDDVSGVLSSVTYYTAEEIALNAKTYAPKDKGELSQSITTRKESEFVSSVVVGVNYGAFVEFGTGKKVSVPRELKTLASKFKGGGGSFEEGLRSIKDWCKTKGIDEKAAYPIFMSILRNGTAPQPYLYPAFVKGRRQYLEDLKSELKNLKKKYG